MTTQTLTATTVRQNFFTLLDKVSQGELTVTIARKGKEDVILAPATTNADAQYLILLKKSQGILTSTEADKVLQVRETSKIPRPHTTW